MFSSSPRLSLSPLMNPLAIDMLDTPSPSPWDGIDRQSSPFIVDVPAPPLMYTPRPQPPQRCIPLSQILPQSSNHPLPQSITPAALSAPAKRPPSPAASRTASPNSPDAAPAPKKSRAARISTAEFIPPDVTGLSKREARLVKNRAAAFLSRQRKREEFEGMEVRVVELENENARLRALASSGTPTPAGLSELEHLRSQLAAAEEREQKLQAEMQSLRLSQRASSQSASSEGSPPPVSFHEPSIKIEDMDDIDASAKSIKRHSHSHGDKEKDKAGPSLGLMVLLFSLSTLISLQNSTTSGSTSRGGPPTRFSFSPIPPQAGPSSFMLDNLMASNFPKKLNEEDEDEDMMDLNFGNPQTRSAVQDVAKAMTGGSSTQFEIDFDLPSPTGESDTAIATLGNQKIKVRIHNPPRSTTSSPWKKETEERFLDWDMPSLPFSDLISNHGDLFGTDSISGFGDPCGPASAEFGIGGKEADLGVFIDEDIFGSGLMSAASPSPSTTSSSTSSTGLSTMTTEGRKENDWLAVAPSPPSSPITSYRPFSSLVSPGDSASAKKKMRIAVRPGSGPDSGEWEVEVFDR